MASSARWETVVERTVRSETIGMAWCCGGRRVNNPRCGLVSGRWFAMDGI